MINRVFHMENPLMRTLAMAYNLMLLNILALFASLPVVTAGAAYTALCESCLMLVRGGDIYVARFFFRSFKKNLKQGSLLGLLFLLAGLVCAVDFLVVRTFFLPFAVFFAAAGIALIPVALYAFCLLARFENTLAGTVKNALRLTAGYFPGTLGMTGFALAFFLAGLRFYRVGMPLLMLFGLSLPAYVAACFYHPVFWKLEGKEEEEDADEYSL